MERWPRESRSGVARCDAANAWQWRHCKACELRSDIPSQRQTVVPFSLPKVLHDAMPIIHVRGITAEEKDTAGKYICPVYTTTIRGPTFTFVAPLPTDRPEHVWILAAVCLVMQPDQ